MWSRVQVRDAALDALDRWVGEVSIEPLLPLLPKALLMDAPAGRVKLLGWLTVFIPALEESEERNALIPPLIKALDDRTNEVCTPPR